jgi:hypothetical protein
VRNAAVRMRRRSPFGQLGARHGVGTDYRICR